MFFLSRSLSDCLCIQNGFIMEEKTTGFGLSAYQPADTTISISAVKWLGLSGARLVISDTVNQKFSTALPYFYITFQQHSGTPISLFIVHTDTAGNREKAAIMNIPQCENVKEKK